jgi:hypothetical protein
VQFVDAAATLRLDLHRFYQPSKNSKWQIGDADSRQISYDSTGTKSA